MNERVKAEETLKRCYPCRRSVLLRMYEVAPGMRPERKMWRSGCGGDDEAGRGSGDDEADKPAAHPTGPGERYAGDAGGSLPQVHFAPCRPTATLPGQSARGAT
jgi:hypothetical protein